MPPPTRVALRGIWARAKFRKREWAADKAFQHPNRLGDSGGVRLIGNVTKRRISVPNFGGVAQTVSKILPKLAGRMSAEKTGNEGEVAQVHSKNERDVTDHASRKATDREAESGP